MIFIVRSDRQQVPPLDVKMVRQTPSRVPGSDGSVDFFCLGNPEAAQAAGWPVVPVHDGWYADDATGGMAIWGQGLFWEVRDTPFAIKEACGPEAWPADGKSDAAATLDVRQAIFGGYSSQR
jgi:hypothetical protein